MDSRVPASAWKRLTKCDSSGCWIWTNPQKSHKGRFKVTIDGKQQPLHRVLVKLAGGQLPSDAGRKLERRCGNDLCCNPAHLQIGLRCKQVTRDLVGQRFGHLLVVGRAPGEKRNHDGAHRKMWWCECDCGKRKTVRECNLLDGESRSCGCRRYELLVRDFSGQRFGRLLVLRQSKQQRPGQNRRWIVRCDCGSEKDVSGGNLPRLTSCGCGTVIDARATTRIVNGETIPVCAYKKRGQSRHPLYGIWRGILTRCFAKTHHAYANYGGRGIAVSERWTGSDGFFNFADDVGPRPSAGHSIDRIDTNGNYEPSNVRWATQSEQMQNTRTARRRVASVLDKLKEKNPELIAELRRELLGSA